MKTILLTIGLTVACLIHAVYGQDKSDLYHHVDSLLTHQLDFDKAAKKEEIKTAIKGASSDTSNVRIVCVSTINEGALLILNQKPVELDELNKYKLRDIKFINVIEPSDTTRALYGLRGAYGVIVIETKKNKNKR